MTQPIFKGDNTSAFRFDGTGFITINLDNPQGFEISKAVFVCGCVEKPFNNPEFPLQINFSSQETQQLRIGKQNICYLVVYDSEGRQQTCQGTLTFAAQTGVLNNGRTCC